MLMIVIQFACRLAFRVRHGRFPRMAMRADLLFLSPGEEERHPDLVPLDVFIDAFLSAPKDADKRAMLMDIAARAGAKHPGKRAYFLGAEQTWE